MQYSKTTIQELLQLKHPSWREKYQDGKVQVELYERTHLLFAVAAVCGSKSKQKAAGRQRCRRSIGLDALIWVAANTQVDHQPSGVTRAIARFDLLVYAGSVTEVFCPNSKY